MDPASCLLSQQQQPASPVLDNEDMIMVDLRPPAPLPPPPEDGGGGDPPPSPQGGEEPAAQAPPAAAAAAGAAEFAVCLQPSNGVNNEDGGVGDNGGGDDEEDHQNQQQRRREERILREYIVDQDIRRRRHSRRVFLEAVNRRLAAAGGGGAAGGADDVGADAGGFWVDGQDDHDGRRGGVLVMAAPRFCSPSDVRALERIRSSDPSVTSLGNGRYRTESWHGSDYVLHHPELYLDAMRQNTTITEAAISLGNYEGDLRGGSDSDTTFSELLGEGLGELRNLRHLTLNVCGSIRYARHVLERATQIRSLKMEFETQREERSGGEEYARLALAFGAHIANLESISVHSSHQPAVYSALFEAMPRMSGLKSVSVSGAYVEGNMLSPVLLYALCCSRSTNKEVKLRFFHFTSLHNEMLAVALNGNPHLKSLTLDFCRIPDGNSHMIGQAFQLEEEHPNDAESAGATAAVAAQPTQPDRYSEPSPSILSSSLSTLEELSLDTCPENLGFYEELAKGIMQSPTIQRLRLSKKRNIVETTFTQGLLRVLLALPSCQSIRDVELHCYAWDVETSEALRAYISAPPTKLERLKISGYEEFQDRSWRLIAPALVDNTSIKVLHLQGFLSAKICRRTIRYLESNTTLRELYIKNCQGVKTLLRCVSSLGNNRGLKELHINHPNPPPTLTTEQGETALEHLRGNYTLGVCPFNIQECSDLDNAEARRRRDLLEFKMKTLLKMNRLGRSYLQEQNPSRVKGARFVAALGDDLNCVFLHLLEFPMLLSRHPY